MIYARAYYKTYLVVMMLDGYRGLESGTGHRLERVVERNGEEEKEDKIQSGYITVGAGR